MKYDDLSNDDKIVWNEHIASMSTEKGRVSYIEDKYFMQMEIMRKELNNLYMDIK